MSERYLAVITRGLDRHRTRYALYFETGTGYDSNIANATDERFVALPALGGVLVELSPDSRENASA